MKAYVKETHPRDEPQHVACFPSLIFSQPHFLQPIIEVVRLDEHYKSETEDWFSFSKQKSKVVVVKAKEVGRKTSEVFSILI